MNWKQTRTIAIGSALLIVLTCSAVRAEYVTVDELDSMRFASRWPDAQPRQTPMPAVVRVIATDRNSMSLGSGTLVDANDEYGLVVTNWHVVRDAVGPVEVLFPDGFHSMARIVRTDKDWDLAALLIWKPAVQPVPLSTVAPQPGETLTIAGYGSGEYKMQSGQCTQYLSPAPGKPSEIVELAAAARHGDSGGPILNNRGELVGVLFGEGGGRTDGSYGGRVNQFLQLCSVDLRQLPTSNTAIAKSSQPKWPASFTPASSPAIAQTDSARFAADTTAAGQPTSKATDPGWENTGVPRIAGRVEESTQNSLSDVRELTISAGSPIRESMPSSPGGTSKAPTFVWFEEIKSFLAAIGVAAVVLQLLRWAGSKS
ncbi:MAG TPA: serine protease [Pirellulales bacterium]